MRVRLIVCLLALVAMTRSAYAAPIGITIRQEQYSTTLSVDATARHNVEAFPDVPLSAVLSQSLSLDTPVLDSLLLLGDTWALAHADTFGVDVNTDAAFFDSPYRGRSSATAETTLLFTPIQDGTAAVDVALIGTDETYFSDGAVSLSDVTTGTVLWSYVWTRGFVGTVPWQHTGPLGTDARWTVESALTTSNQYRLTMRTHTDANTDDQSMQMRIAGLYRVPEPGSLSLLVVGVTTIWRRKRHRITT